MCVGVLRGGGLSRNTEALKPNGETFPHRSSEIDNVLCSCSMERVCIQFHEKVKDSQR